MSLKGSIARGEKWHRLCPDTTDKDKLVDIALYLNSKKAEVKPKEIKEKK